MPNNRTRLSTGIALVVILLLALCVRSYHIGSLPSGLYPDETVNGIDAIHANETGKYLLFYPNNNGREGLFINLQALALKTFGYSATALKLWSIIFGTLTVLGLYLLAKELFKRRLAGLIAALIGATSYWAINFSRIGFRAIMVPFILSFTFYFFFRGLRTRQYRDFIASGLFLGLGLHTYIAFRLTPAVFILLLPALFLSYENFLRRFWKHALLFTFAAAFTAAPLVYHFLVSHPEDFASRSQSISVLSPSVNHGHLLQTIGKTFGASLIKYTFWGDQNWRHNYPPYPILDPVVGTLFLAGFLFILSRTIALYGRRLRDHDRDLRLVTDTFLLAAFFVMLAPEFLTAEGLPHALRSIGTQPPVFLLATLPALWLADKARRSPAGRSLALGSLLIISLGTSVLFNLTKYFVFFAENPSQHSAFNENYANMAHYLLDLPDATHKYILTNAGGTIIDNGLPVTAQPIVFLTYQKIHNLEFLQPETTIVRPSVILMMNFDDTIAGNILHIAPDARIENIDLHPGFGSDFRIITLPAIQPQPAS